MRMSFASVVGVDEEPALNDTAFRFKSDIARAQIITRLRSSSVAQAPRPSFKTNQLLLENSFIKSKMMAVFRIVESARQFCGLWRFKKKGTLGPISWAGAFAFGTRNR